jgi:hypothetical protein
VTLADPRGLRSGASYAEFLIFDEGCPDGDDLREGKYPDPFFVQRLDAVDDFAPPGTLDARRYGFAAVLRTEDCAVLGVGCTEANLADRIEAVIVPLDGVAPPKGACPGACRRGRCDDEDDEKDEARGASARAGHSGRGPYASLACAWVDGG